MKRDRHKKEPLFAQRLDDELISELFEYSFDVIFYFKIKNIFFLWTKRNLEPFNPALSKLDLNSSLCSVTQLFRIHMLLKEKKTFLSFQPPSDSKWHPQRSISSMSLSPQFRGRNEGRLDSGLSTSGKR